MTKTLVISFLLLSGFAQANCKGEAQLLGKVKRTAVSMGSCTVYLTESSEVKNSAVCAIDEDQLKTDGLEVGLENGHDCRFRVGDTISGYIIDNGSYLYLEE